MTAIKMIIKDVSLIVLGSWTAGTVQVEPLLQQQRAILNAVMELSFLLTVKTATTASKQTILVAIQTVSEQYQATHVLTKL